MDGTVAFRHGGEWNRPVTVPCGQCFGCRLERSRQWAVRCLHEASQHEKNSFLTLTYSDKFLPENGTLVLDDWQRFAKRARKEMGPFRFFHCGEYGDENGRPHYHALIFGHDFRGDRQSWDGKNGNEYWRSPTLEKLWPLGQSVIGKVTLQSAAYVARYVMKKKTGKLAENHYERVNTATGEVIQLKPEYITMSRGGRGGGGGIGKGWIEKFASDIYPADFVVVDGVKSRPPKFYDNHWAENHEEAMEELKKKRIQEGKKNEWNRTPERLAVRERVARAKGQFMKREV